MTVTPPSNPPRSLRRVLAILAWILLGTLGAGVLVVAMGFPYMFQVARVEGQAMAPTIRNQDRLVVDKLAYRGQRPQRGDIVMLHYPVDPSKKFVKRVIAQPGDRLYIRAGQVFLDGQPYDDSYVLPEFRGAGDWGPGVVPDGHYFVMGDRRTNSSDSRHWGVVPAGYIVGKVALRWWPVADARRY